MLHCFVDMEATYAEYEEWSEHGVAETVIHQYKKALEQLAKYKSYEDALVTGLIIQSPADILLKLVLKNAFFLTSYLHVLVFLQMAAEPPKLAEYQSYIDFELKEGDPARIQITFERTLAENCLVPDMWGKYTTYLVSNGLSGGL